MIDRELQSSPPRPSYSQELEDQLFDTSLDEDYELHSEDSVVNNIISKRRETRSRYMQPMSVTTRQCRRLYRYASQSRQAFKEDKLLRNRGDIERFVMSKERQRAITELSKEADLHAVHEDEIDLLVDEIIQQKPVLDEDTSLLPNDVSMTPDSPSAPVASAKDDVDDEYCDDEELINLLEQQEEYERWALEEQRQIQEMLEAFNIS